MSDLYNSDFYSWTQKQVSLIREGRLNELDLENILEEIESMGRSDYRALESRLTVLFMHTVEMAISAREAAKRSQLGADNQRAAKADSAFAA